MESVIESRPDQSGLIAPGPARSSCPACDLPVSDACSVVSYGAFRLTRCAKCGFGFVANPVPETALARYYAEIYGVEQADFHHALQARGARKNARRIIRALKRRGVAPSAPLLDVGAGFGYLVAELRRAGIPAEGVEPSRAGAAFARASLDAPVRHGMTGDLIAEGRRFAVVTLCDVIEHMRHPRALLADCRQLLAPGGLLLVRTDHFESTVARLMGLHFYRLTPVEHIALMTPASLRAMATAEGLETLETSTWSPPFAIRWAIKHRLKRALGRLGPPPDPLTKHRLGGRMSWAGRLAEPFFALLAPLVDRDGHGVEFMTILRRPSADHAGWSAPPTDGSA